MPRTKQVARALPMREKPTNWDIQINESTVIQCNKEVVISLSPTIAKYVEENPLSKSYDIEMTIASVSNNSLNKLSSYLKGDYIIVNIIDVPFYLEISKKLDLKDLSKFLEEVSSDIKKSCDYTIKNYDKENPFLLELESLEKTIFELNKNNFQSTIKYILDFFDEDNEKSRLKYFAQLIYQFCMTRNSQENFNLGIELIIQIIQSKNQVKKEFIDFLTPEITSDIKKQYFARTLYEKQIFTSEDMKSFINLFKSNEKYDNNFGYLPSNFIFFFDFIIKGLVSNKLKFQRKKYGITLELIIRIIRK